MVTEELMALLLKRSTDFGGNEFADIQVFVSVASCVDEQKH
jgi:hypothetical protein